MTTPDLRTAVREKYRSIAAGRTQGCGCGRAADASAIAAVIGYTPDQLATLPDGANLGLGCGNPLAHARLRAGEVVLDLGSGAGMDAFLAARDVGLEGRVIGVDMTPEMVERARANAVAAGIGNAEFRVGLIEELPLDDASVDVVISNCVINLSTDKPRVFREAFRVLKPGGRLVVSDLVLESELPCELRDDLEAYVGCLAGAVRLESYAADLAAAGFTEVAVLEKRGYGTADVFGGDENLRKAACAITSAKLRAVKPEVPPT
jgi:SAM-dependent methyltransferase